MRQVLEVAAYWGGELFSIDYVSPRKRLDVPEGLEVRTRLVEAAARIPRSPMDVPYLAIATIAACAHALVVSSFATSVPVIDRHDVITDDRTSLFATSEPDTIGITVRSHDDDVESEPRAEHGIDLAGRDSVSLEEARTFGVIALLHDDAGDHATTSWARPPGDGSALWGDAVGDAFGAPGLSLSGVGQGGGGNALGNHVLERVHTESVFTEHGHLAAAHTVGWHCTLRIIEPTVSNRLPAEAIRRVVHANLGRFRSCYEKGLARDPRLEGRVATKFVIARDGTVAAVADAGSDLSDAEVVACIQRAFSTIEFPEPPNGVVNVVYPIELSPTP